MTLVSRAALATALLIATPLLSHAQTAAPAPGAAASAPEAAPADPLSFNIGAFTEYRYRGISQTRFNPAVQGGIDYAPASGLYVGTWMSNINWIHDLGADAHANVGRAPVEWDLYGGYKGSITADLSYDVGVLAYYYPDNHLGAIAGSKNADTVELYGALTYGPVTVKYSNAVTTLFGFQDSRNSGYLEGAASFDVGNGFSVAPHLGYQHVTGSANHDASYTDYSLTGSKDFGNGWVVSLAGIGTNAKLDTYASPGGKNLGRGTVVLGVKKTF